MSMGRRDFLALISAAGMGATPYKLTGHSSLVDKYSPEREDALYGGKLPLVAVYRKEDLALAFVAAVHGTEADSPTFRAVAEGFALIQPSVVVIEGFPWSLGPDPRRIVRQVQNRHSPAASSYARGEDVHAASLALKRHVPFYGGELTDAELLKALNAEGFAAQDVFFASMFGPLTQDARAGAFSGPSDPRFKAAYDRWRAEISPAYPAAMPSDVLAFASWYARIYGKPIETDPKWLDRGGPGEPEIAGRIGNAQNLIRDQRLFGLMINLLDTERRVLTVFGGSHLSSLWRALADALGSPTLVLVQ